MTQTVQLDDIELHVFDEGHGEPILFVHGFPLDHTMWQAQLEEFSTSHRVIAPDLRGFGQSEVTSGIVTMERFADDLNDILDALNITGPVTLCGLSMGGYIAWQFWKRHPQRLARLILCDTRSIPDTPDMKQNRRESADRVLREGTEFVAESMPEKLYSQKSFEEQPELISSTKQTILSNAPAGVAAAFMGMAARPDVTDWLPEIQVPALVVVGEEDAICSVDEMRAIADGLPQSQFEVIPNAGHMAPQEQPKIVNLHIRKFLT